MNKSDLIIIGSGPGGYRAAEYAARNGLKVVVVESAQAGGTCLNCGCIPTKAFCHDAELADIRQSFDFQQIVERKQQIVEQLRTGVETLMQQPGITFVHGHGHFLDENTVEVVSTVDEETVVQQFQAKNIIIATGSRTKILPIEGITGPNCVTSTELLDIQEVPKRLCIIGAGVIGMEFASVFASFGSEVTVVEYLKECLPALDSDIAKRLRKYLEKQGITFKMKTAVENIADIDADVILMATGRKPRTEGYTNVDENFQVLTVPEPAERAVPVERTVPEPVEGLYAIGDVNGRQMLAHAAEMQAVRAVNHILGKKDNIRFDIMPAAIFTEPEAACVGPTEDQLKASGTAYTCKKSFWRANQREGSRDECHGGNAETLCIPC